MAGLLILGSVGFLLGNVAARCWAFMVPAPPPPPLRERLKQVLLRDEERSGVGVGTPVEVGGRALADSPELTTLQSATRRNPLAAIGGWLAQAGAGGPATNAERLSQWQTLHEVWASERDEPRYTENLTWLGLQQDVFDFGPRWKADGGMTLARELAEDSRGVDRLRVAADIKPAGSWWETAEWVADSAVGTTVDRSRVVAQMYERSRREEGLVVAEEALRSATSPVFDEAKVLTVAAALATDPGRAKQVWQSISEPSAQVVAVSEVLLTPGNTEPSRQEARTWLVESGLSETPAGRGLLALIAARTRGGGLGGN